MTEKGSGRMSEKERCAEPFSQGASPEGPPSTTTCNEGPSEYIRARSACNDLRASRSTLRRGGLGFFDRSTVPVTVEEDPVERRREETRGNRQRSVVKTTRQDHSNDLNKRQTPTNTKNTAPRSLAKEKIPGIKTRSRPDSRNKEPRLWHCRAAFKNLTSHKIKRKKEFRFESPSYASRTRPFVHLYKANAHTLPGLTTRTARENEAAAIKGNQGINHGINQSTGRRGRIKIGGCSRNPTSGGSQLSGEEPKRVPKRIRNVSGAISFSPMIVGDRRGSRATVATILQSSTRQSIIFIASTGFVGFLAIIAHHWLKLSHLYIFAYKRGKQAFTAPSNETSSRRTQNNSANSSIVRTFRHQPQDQRQQCFFVGPNHLPFSTKVYSTPARRLQSSITRSPNVKLSEPQKSPDWRKLHLSFSPDRRAKASQRNRTLSTQHLEHPRKICESLDSVSHQNWIGKDKTSLLAKGSRHGWNRSSDLNPATLRSIRRHKCKSHTLRIIISQSITKRPQQDARPFFSFVYVYDLQEAYRGSYREENVSRYTSLYVLYALQHHQRDNNSILIISRFLSNRRLIDQTRMSIDGMQIKASEQIKSAKSQNRKSRQSKQQRSKTDLKSDPRQISQPKSREVGGKIDIQSRCHPRNQLKNH
ncbi:hypothetical protein DBV15_02850 [Temnothorax longispinosus]|uniref:Uncharacterized protein n=1 Tax=Temnothorax longispinosus TaxID=300112 RepID=A0A4S2L8F2_9HYME|nr:hypothetical protein DBV15_02850 [Temnothorax longispinosus]